MEENIFLISFFKELNEQKIKYAVLRNYQDLPKSTNGSDIDIYIKENDFINFHKILNITTEKYGGKIISILEATNVKDVVTIGFYNDEWWGVRFDTFTFVGTNDCKIFTNGYINNKIELYNGVKVLNYKDSILVAFVKDIIGANKYNKRYSEKAKEIFKENFENYRLEFLKVMTEKSFEKYLCPLLFDKISFTKQTAQKIHQGFNYKQNLIGLSNFIKHYYYKFKRIIHTPGVSIAMMGVDGAGKTTIFKEIKPILEEALHNKIIYSHMRPNLIPNIAQLFGKPTMDSVVENPHEHKSSGVILSLLRILYYSFDYIFGYWILVHFLLAKKTTVWIFDRYFYDYYIDAKRGRIGLPKGIIRFIGRFIPKPNIILCFGADAEKIFKRKPELNLYEIKRQVKELKEFSSKQPNSIWIDTGGEILKTKNEALFFIMNKMAERYY